MIRQQRVRARVWGTGVVMASLCFSAQTLAEEGSGPSVQLPTSPRFGMKGGVGAFAISRASDAATDQPSQRALAFGVGFSVDAEWFFGSLGLGPRLAGVTALRAAPLSYASLDLSLRATLPLVDVEQGGVRAMLGAGPAIATTFEPPSFGVERTQGLPVGWCAFAGLDVVIPSSSNTRPALELRIEDRQHGFDERMTNSEGGVAESRARIGSLGVVVALGVVF